MGFFTDLATAIGFKFSERHTTKFERERKRRWDDKRYKHWEGVAKELMKFDTKHKATIAKIMHDNMHPSWIYFEQHAPEEIVTRVKIKSKIED
jgi:HD superfamily phosphohydrolase YqeK